MDGVLQARLFSEERTGKRRTQSGETTSRVVLSAHVGNNADVFAEVLRLHVPSKASVIDVTWGKGVFWQRVPKDAYRVTKSDISMGTDCRKLPFEGRTFDCVVFDPPYMEGLFRRSSSHMAGSGSHSAFRKAYSNGQPIEEGGPKWHAAVTDLYFKGGREAYRVLKQSGILILNARMK